MRGGLAVLSVAAAVRLCEMKPERFSPAHNSPHLAGARLQQPLCGRAGKRRRTPEGGDAAARFLILRRPTPRPSRPERRSPSTGTPSPASLKKARRRARAGADPRRGHGNPHGGNRDHRIRPLTSDALARAIGALTGGDYLYFYDAISPIVEGIPSISIASSRHPVMGTAKRTT